MGAGSDLGERFGREPGNGGKKGGREPLEVDCCGGQERLDTHVIEGAPGLGPAVDALDAPSMPLIKALLPLSPLEPLAPGPQQSRVVYIEDDDAGVARGADAARPKRTRAAISGTGVKVLEKAPR